MGNVSFRQVLRRLEWRLVHRNPKLARLQHRLGYFFANRNLLVQTITHRSVHPESRKNYERLEFLGDAIIDYVVSRRLMAEFPDRSEGFLTQKRSDLVQTSFLARMGRSLGLLDMISVTPSVDLTQDKVSQNQLANVFEAVMAGIFLDGGIKPCERLIRKTLWEHRREAWRTVNYKGLLIEHCQAKGLDTPRFLVTKTTGPEHKKVFEVKVKIGNQISPPGNGETKKAAEQEAAQITLDFLRS